MGTSAHDFLRWILPTAGYKCATIVRADNGAKYNKHFATIDELADFILAQDAWGNTAYHACASFRTVESRKGENALSARSFWLDVDCGPDKPYPDAAAGAQALGLFCRSVGLPSPLYVGSGSGVHAYWPLEQDLDVGHWRGIAAQLKQLCSNRRLEVDRVRTADIASILRTPGTHNRKGGLDRLVECGPLVGPYEITKFCSDAGLTYEAQITQSYRQPEQSIIAKALSLYGEADADPDLCVERCRQLAGVCEDPSRYSEPIIYGFLGIAAHCREGIEFAHDVFDEEWHGEVDKKLAQQEAFGPTTCAHFRNLNPVGCEGCPFWGRITSPIQLGKGNGRFDSLASAAQPSPPQSYGGQSSQVVEVTQANGQTLPEGFLINNGRMVFQKENPRGEPVQMLVSEHPIMLHSVQTAEVDGQSFSLVFDLQLPRARRSIIVAAKTFFSNSGISEIAGQGAVIHEPDLFKRYARQAIDIWHKQKDVDLRYDQFGWKDDDTSFLWGKRLYRSSTVEAVVGSPELEHRSQYLGPSRGGSLDAWTGAANQLFAAGLEPQSFGLLCAFGAPLMRFHTREEGGAIVSLVSDQSGSGKTTTLEAAASVWGRLKGTKLADNDTKVAQGLKLGVMGNLPCTYDEMASKDPEIIRQFVLMFTGGQDKDRGKSDGTLIHAKSEWQTILLLASNKPLVDILSNVDTSDAPAYRLLEFNANLPPGTDHRKGDSIRSALAANSGYAGDRFLRLLLQPEVLAFVRAGLPKWTDQIWQRTGLESKHRFWVRTLASVIAGGTIAQRYGIIDFSIQRIADWACDYIKDRADLAHPGTRDEREVLVEFINNNIKNMLVVPGPWEPKKYLPPSIVPRDKLFIRIEKRDNVAYILEGPLRKYLVDRGIHRTQFEQRLLTNKVMVSAHKRVTLGAGTDYAAGQATCYQIDMGHPAMGGVLREVQLAETLAMNDGSESSRITKLAEHRGNAT